MQPMMRYVGINTPKKVNKAESKAILIQGGQSTTGSQDTSTARMTIFDRAKMASQDKGLDFLEFPGEVRNEIYKLVADYVIEKTDSRACLAIYSSDEWDWKKDKRLTLRGNPQLMILQPGLFLTCRQIRTEGLPFFYQRREFDLRLDHGKRILDLYWDQAGFSYWFQAIGDVGQQNIRHLTLRNTTAMKGINCIERIHRKLSDKATVVYKADKDVCDNGRLLAKGLWKIGAQYEAKNKEKVPIFWNKSTRKILKFDQRPEDLRNCELEFEAGSGWFGMAQNDKAQLWWRRDKRIEKWNETWLAKDKRSRKAMMVKKKIGHGDRRPVNGYFHSWGREDFLDEDTFVGSDGRMILCSGSVVRKCETLVDGDSSTDED